MNAWLITWEWGGDHARVRDPLVAILSSRKSINSIAEVAEFLYLRATGGAADLAYYANRRKQLPFPAKTDQNCITCCGHNPWLYARVVSKLRVEATADGAEVIRWREPDTYGLDENDQVVVKHEGVSKELVRAEAGPVGKELSELRCGGPRQ